jgi:hypothetical protein
MITLLKKKCQGSCPSINTYTQLLLLPLIHLGTLQQNSAVGIYLAIFNAETLQAGGNSINKIAN